MKYFKALCELYGAQERTRTSTAINHWYLKPARLPIPPPGPRRPDKEPSLALSTIRRRMRDAGHGRGRAARAGWVGPFARPNDDMAVLGHARIGVRVGRDVR